MSRNQDIGPKCSCPNCGTHSEHILQKDGSWILVNTAVDHTEHNGVKLYHCEKCGFIMLFTRSLSNPFPKT